MYDLALAQGPFKFHCSYPYRIDFCIYVLLDKASHKSSNDISMKDCISLYSNALYVVKALNSNFPVELFLKFILAGVWVTKLPMLVGGGLYVRIRINNTNDENEG